MAEIMIVDDSAFMRVVLKEMLEKAGHRIVAEADNGLDAVGTANGIGQARTVKAVTEKRILN